MICYELDAKGKGERKVDDIGDDNDDFQQPKQKRNKQRVLLLSFRGITHRSGGMRHLMNDLEALLPHAKKVIQIVDSNPEFVAPASASVRSMIRHATGGKYPATEGRPGGDLEEKGASAMLGGPLSLGIRLCYHFDLDERGVYLNLEEQDVEGHTINCVNITFRSHRATQIQISWTGWRASNTSTTSESLFAHIWHRESGALEVS
ncbi:uncharacterized protein EDB91DRAFT_1285925 [Suillus paluster]|uniref:uncharacterized protein n=1 Tax=Suillus paluster TaxID=48578 RepID=UPI001B8688CF|nr:uncharacterized protein EDB91DRAFT_1285925 [Suillus paluster]KAG1753615.1 hypothetical protein EDB91DRAFT_1285925 [Suillus paluster]